MANYYEGGLNNGAGPMYPPPQDSSQIGGAAGGAATGAAVGGPWGAVIGAVAGLLMQHQQRKEQEKAQKRAFELAEREKAQRGVLAMQNQLINTAGDMGNREQSAIANLINVFGRATR